MNKITLRLLILAIHLNGCIVTTNMANDPIVPDEAMHISDYFQDWEDSSDDVAPWQEVDLASERAKLQLFLDSMKGGSKKEAEYFSDLDMNYELEADHPSLEECFNEKVPALVQNIIQTLKNPTRFAKKRYGRLEKNLILHGPPGTGKTTVAQIIAKETGRRLFGKNAGTFQTVYQASEVASLKNLFDTAKRYGKPCIVFIDEIDGIMSQLSHTSKQDNNKTLKALIGHLDEIKGNTNIYVIATTNYLSKLDRANADRFFAVEMPAPKDVARKKIIKKYLDLCEIYIEGDKEITEDVIDRVISPEFFNFLTTATAGLTGRSLKALIKDAAIRLDNGIEVAIDKPGFFKEMVNFYRVVTFDLDYRKQYRDFMTNYWSCKKKTLIEQHLYACILDERSKINDMDDGKYRSAVEKNMKGILLTAKVAAVSFSAAAFTALVIEKVLPSKFKRFVKHKIAHMTGQVIDDEADKKPENQNVHEKNARGVLPGAQAVNA